MSSIGKAGSLIDFRIAVEKHEVLDSSILALNEDWKEGKINWYSHRLPGYICDISLVTSLVTNLVTP